MVVRPDAQRPSTWKKYRNGLCTGCWGGCCTLPLEVSVPDLIRLGLTTEEEAAVSLRDMGRRLQKEKAIQAFNQKTQVFIISQRANSDCIYLHEKTRLCTVYEKRPEVCRQFPKIGPRPGFCPAGPKSKG